MHTLTHTLGHCGFYELRRNGKGCQRKTTTQQRSSLRFKEKRRRSTGENRENEITDLLKQYSVPYKKTK